MRFQLPRISEAKNYILTAFFLVISIVLLFGRNEGGINNLRTVSITLFSYLEEPLSNLRVYRQALKTNSNLRRQNTLLIDELNRLRSTQQQIDELQNLLEFSRNSNLNLYPAQIIGKKLDQINNVLTIDAGSRNGIEQGMPVISADGLIGKVILTSPQYSQVMPYFNTLFRVSAKLQKTNAYGIVSWNSENGENIEELELKHVPQTIAVDTGDVVVTSGYSQEYPPNIPIGKVTKHQPNKGKDTQQIFIQPFANLYTVSNGFVVTTKPDTSIDSLKSNYQQLFK